MSKECSYIYCKITVDKITGEVSVAYSGKVLEERAGIDTGLADFTWKTETDRYTHIHDFYSTDNYEPGKQDIKIKELCEQAVKALKEES